MIQLIKMEWKKHNIVKYIRNAVILIVLLNAFLFAQCYLGIANDPDTGVPDAAPGSFNISSQVELLTNVSFLVFTCVMLASFIISAYKNKTMNLMFSYPIRRQRIIISKMLAVWIFNFTALTVAKLLIYGILFYASRFMTSDFPIDYNMTSIGFYIQIILKSAVTVTIGFIALFVGRVFKSSKATIVASFLLFFLMNGTVGDFTLADNAIFPIVLTVISIFCAFLSVFNIEKMDVM